MARPEVLPAIQQYLDRGGSAIGWSCQTDGVGASPHKQVTITSEDGFHFVFTVLDSEGLDTDQIVKDCLHDTIDEIRSRRQE